MASHQGRFGGDDSKRQRLSDDHDGTGYPGGIHLFRHQETRAHQSYVKQTNEHEVHYLTETGFTVLHELGLGLESDGYSAVTPEEWIKIVKENTRPDADGYFLSCTNTRMIEAINDLEQDLGKPVISSNQATLWACLKKLGIAHTNKALGRLFQQN